MSCPLTTGPKQRDIKHEQETWWRDIEHSHVDYYSHHTYANGLVYAVLGHGLLHTLSRTGAIHNWYPAFTASPGVLQEITTDPITVCIQDALVNLCKSHNCSWFYNSWTRARGTGTAPASITQPPMSASSTSALHRERVNMCKCVCVFACMLTNMHIHMHTHTHKAK